MPAEVTSRYPFSPDGAFPWPVDEPWFDPLVALSFAAACTERVELGVGVLIAPLRHPVVLAKQVASLDAYSGGRLVLGVGAGWMARSSISSASPWPSARGGSRTRCEILRSCWQGRSTAHAGAVLSVEEGALVRPHPGARRPRPLRRLERRRAPARRAARQRLRRLRPRDGDRRRRDHRRRRHDPRRSGGRQVGSTPSTGSSTGSRAGPTRSPPSIPALAAAGVTDVVVTTSWSDPDGPARTADAIRGRQR